MLHGYAVIIKRTGEDGSKYPVTERDVKIGTTAGCRILINTPYVESEHCILLVKDDGEVWAKNLSLCHPTVINQVPLDGETLLCHGDILEIGGRLVRWEYLPDSKFYRFNNRNDALKRKNGTPMKHVTPKKPSSLAKTPASLKKSSDSKNLPKTPLSANALSKGGSLSGRRTANMAKIITGRKSLQATKRLFSPVDKKRRQSEAILKLNDEDLLQIAIVRAGKMATPTKTPVKSRLSENHATPVKRLGSPAVRVGKTSWNMKTPGLMTITEANTNRINYKTPLKTSPKVALKSAKHSSPIAILDMCTDPLKHKQSSPASPSGKQMAKVATPVSTNPLTKTPVLFSPSSTGKITPRISRELSNLSISMSTPPEVTTPTGSSPTSSPGRDRKRQALVTPSEIVFESPIETPPEVVTPFSSPSRSPFKKPRMSLTPLRSFSSTPGKPGQKEFHITEVTPSPVKGSPSKGNLYLRSPSAMSPAKKPPLRKSSPMKISTLVELSLYKDALSTPSTAMEVTTRKSGNNTKMTPVSVPRSGSKKTPTPGKNIGTPNSGQRRSSSPVKTFSPDQGAKKTSAKNTKTAAFKTPTPVKRITTPNSGKSAKSTPVKSLSSEKGARKTPIRTTKTDNFKTPSPVKRVTTPNSGKSVNTPRKSPSPNKNTKNTPVKATRTAAFKTPTPVKRVTTPNSGKSVNAPRKSPSPNKSTKNTPVKATRTAAIKTPTPVKRVTTPNSGKSVNTPRNSPSPNKSTKNTPVKATRTAAFKTPTPVKRVTTPNSGKSVNTPRKSPSPNKSTKNTPVKATRTAAIKTPTPVKRVTTPNSGKSTNTPRKSPSPNKSTKNTPVKATRTAASKTPTPVKKIKTPNSGKRASSTPVKVISPDKGAKKSPVRASKTAVFNTPTPPKNMKTPSSGQSASTLISPVQGARNTTALKTATPVKHLGTSNSPKSAYSTPITSPSPGKDARGSPVRTANSGAFKTPTPAKNIKTPKSGKSTSNSPLERVSPGTSATKIPARSPGKSVSLKISKVASPSKFAPTPTLGKKGGNTLVKSAIKNIKYLESLRSGKKTRSTVSGKSSTTTTPLNSTNHSTPKINSPIKSAKKTPLRSVKGTPAIAKSSKKSPVSVSGRVSKSPLKSENAKEFTSNTDKMKSVSKSKFAQKIAGEEKLSSKPDKHKMKVLLVLRKASQIKANNELKMKQKLLKKAIKVTNKPVKKTVKVKEASDVVAQKKSPVTPVKKLPSPRKESIRSQDKTKLTRKRESSSLFSPQSLATSADIGSVLMELQPPNATPANFVRSSSKRIRSKNDVNKPDFTELLPAALGLSPLPVLADKKKGRRSISLTTPRAKIPVGIIKAVSTSKKRTNKSVVFSLGAKENEPGNSTFDFSTPDISQDVFVSPLMTPSSYCSSPPGSQRKRGSRSSGVSSALKNSTRRTSASEDLMSFQTPNKSMCVEPLKTELQTPLIVINDSVMQALMGTRDSKKKLSQKLVDSTQKKSPKKNVLVSKPQQKSPRNSLSDVTGLRTLFASGKSPKNDLNNVTGVKRLLAKSPKNDLRHVNSIRRLMKTPDAKKGIRLAKTVFQQQPAKSPKNDLTNVAGVKKMFSSPKQLKSPKNDLRRVTGVRALFAPGNSPKNDLTNVTGVKRVFAKTPKNDLRHVSSIRRLMKTPPNAKKGKTVRPRQPANSPKNDLTNVAGVKKMFASPKELKSPKNDLRRVTGVKELFISSEVLSSPVAKRVRGAIASPIRPTRSCKVAVTTDKKGAPTEPVKLDKESPLKQNSPVKLRSRRAVSSASSPKVQKVSADSPRLRRGPKRIAAEDTENNPEKNSDADNRKKPVRVVKSRVASVKKSPVNKKRGTDDMLPSPSPKKRATRTGQTVAAGTKRSLRGKSATSATLSPNRSPNKAVVSLATSPGLRKTTRGGKAAAVVSPTEKKRSRMRKIQLTSNPEMSPSSKKSAGSSSSSSSPSPKIRTRGRIAKSVPVLNSSPSPKIRTRGRMAASQRTNPSKK